jgi:hypothetical protein
MKLATLCVVVQHISHICSTATMSLEATEGSSKELRESARWNPRRHDLDSGTDLPPRQKDLGPAAEPATGKPQPKAEDSREVHEAADRWNPMTHTADQAEESPEAKGPHGGSSSSEQAPD